MGFWSNFFRTTSTGRHSTSFAPQRSGPQPVSIAQAHAEGVISHGENDAIAMAERALDEALADQRFWSDRGEQAAWDVNAEPGAGASAYRAATERILQAKAELGLQKMVLALETTDYDGPEEWRRSAGSPDGTHLPELDHDAVLDQQMALGEQMAAAGLDPVEFNVSQLEHDVAQAEQDAHRVESARNEHGGQFWDPEDVDIYEHAEMEAMNAGDAELTTQYGPDWEDVVSTPTWAGGAAVDHHGPDEVAEADHEDALVENAYRAAHGGQAPPAEWTPHDGELIALDPEQATNRVMDAGYQALEDDADPKTAEYRAWADMHAPGADVSPFPWARGSQVEEITGFPLASAEQEEIAVEGVPTPDQYRPSQIVRMREDLASATDTKSGTGQAWIDAHSYWADVPAERVIERTHEEHNNAYNNHAGIKAWSEADAWHVDRLHEDALAEDLAREGLQEKARDEDGDEIR